MRHAAELAERDDKRDERDDKKQRLARGRQKNSCAQNRGHDQINQNCQSKFHRSNCNVSGVSRK